MPHPDIPVAVIGAGPQGLAAAAHLLERGIEPLVLESGPTAATAVRGWGHVRLFSPWPEVVDPAGVRLLTRHDLTPPTTGFPTGAEWVSDYLDPLAAALGSRVRYSRRVTGVSRRGRDRLVSQGREQQPFVLHLIDDAGAESRVEARAVIDASGTWGSPNPAGADGLPAIGEAAAVRAGVVTSTPPTPAEADALRGRRVVVVGSGHSALTAVIQLGAVVRSAPDTEVSWVVRRGGVGQTFGGGAADQLAERGRLGLRAREAVESGSVRMVTAYRVSVVEPGEAGVTLVSDDGRRIGADRVFALTGFRPDLSLLSELRLDLDPTLEAPRPLAGRIDPNLHSCGSVEPHGAAELAHPEPDLYVVGMKSYGRAPTFLALTGYEQVRSVAAALAGDAEAAARVELVLPDTGVCGGSGQFDVTEATTTGCCSASPSDTGALTRAGTSPS